MFSIVRQPPMAEFKGVPCCALKKKAHVQAPLTFAGHFLCSSISFGPAGLVLGNMLRGEHGGPWQDVAQKNLNADIHGEEQIPPEGRCGSRVPPPSQLHRSGSQSPLPPPQFLSLVFVALITK